MRQEVPVLRYHAAPYSHSMDSNSLGPGPEIPNPKLQEHSPSKVSGSRLRNVKHKTPKPEGAEFEFRVWGFGSKFGDSGQVCCSGFRVWGLGSSAKESPKVRIGSITGK